MIEYSLDKFEQKVYKPLLPKIKIKKFEDIKKDNNEADMIKFLGLEED